MISRLAARLLLPLAVGSLAPAALPAGGDAWMADLDPALERAAREGKDLLVDFTGSDWCSWCIRLDKEVFQHDEFLDYATEHFVLVALDFPRQGGEVYSKMPADLRRRNEAQSQALGVQGFPTIVLMTPQGVAYAKTGYQAGGAEEYVSHLEELRTGEERARLSDRIDTLRAASSSSEDKLDAAYDLLGSVRAGLRDEIVDVIRRLDADDSRGVLRQLAQERALSRLDAVLGAHLGGGEPDEAGWSALADALDDLASEEPSMHEVAAFHYYRGMVAVEQGDAAKARACLAKLEGSEDVQAQALDYLRQRIEGLGEEG